MAPPGSEETGDPPPPPRTPTPSSTPAKQVSFTDPPFISSPIPSSSSASSTSSIPPLPEITLATPKRTPLARRRSSLKEGISMPSIPPKEYYQHPDPLVRRLRLRDNQGNEVCLKDEFRDTTVVAFLFGATWSGPARDHYTLVETFARKHPHRLKVVYVSIDNTEQQYLDNTRGKPWLSMEWNDGSNPTDPPTPFSTPNTPPPLPPPPLEPFLLAMDQDLELEVHLHDPLGTLYLRPYSRAHLTEKFRVLQVPSLTVYHIPKKEVLTTRARWEGLKDGREGITWDRWERGEGGDWAFGDLVQGARWVLGMGVGVMAYVVAVRVGGVEDVVGRVTEQLSRNYFLGR